MPTLGKAQRNKTPETFHERSQRVTATLPAPLATKVAVAALASGRSISGIINELIERMETSEDGRPEWAPPREDQLPLAHAS